MEAIKKCVRFESPHFPVQRKCCYCIPLRRGVIIYAYINLINTLLSFPILIFMLVEWNTSGKITITSIQIEPSVHLPISIFLGVVDVVLTISLLVAAHMRNRNLMKKYFYAGLVYTLVTVCVDLACFEFEYYIQNLGYFTVVVFNIYLLFLVYNVVYILQQEALVQYVTYREQRIAP